MNDSYIYVITALLPLSAFMLVIQVNPYHALVVQGILGGVSALVFAVLGAADVALTQALMGTLLAITLYVVAVRSSMVMRLGVLEDEAATDKNLLFGQLIEDLRSLSRKYYMRLELVNYKDTQELEQALIEREVHATCLLRSPELQNDLEAKQPYHTTTRVQRLYDIMKTELSSPATVLTYVTIPESKEKH